MLYKNPYFLVKKKEENKYHLINNAVKINRVIIKDGNLFLVINEFSKKFNNCAITSLINFFFGYNQIELNERSKNLTSFHILIKFYKMTTLPQNATNSVAQFMRVIIKILQDHLSRSLPFINDIGVKNPKIIYNNKKIAPSIRKYMLKHI